jgi:aminoglycoside phosphotransferase (APT) family kinase protein
VKLFYGADERGVWALGSDMILKERPNSLPRNEALNVDFIRSCTTIPAPSIFREWIDSSDRYFLLMERMKGQTLRAAWTTLSLPQKNNIADQVATAIQQLRRLQSPIIQSLDGGPVYSGWLFLNGSKTPYGPFLSDTDLRSSLVGALKSLPPEAVSRFQDRVPECTPYTFTHGDLNCENIIVEDGQLVGILDWEYAGYFPVWWEYVAMSIGLSSEDAEWKSLLRERLSSHQAAREFWVDLYSLSMYPDLDERGQYLLRSLLEEQKDSSGNCADIL